MEDIKLLLTQYSDDELAEMYKLIANEQKKRKDAEINKVVKDLKKNLEFLKKLNSCIWVESDDFTFGEWCRIEVDLDGNSDLHIKLYAA